MCLAPHLEAVATRTVAVPANTALRHLIETTEVAQRLGQGLEPADITFTLSGLDGVPTGDRPGFLNQYQFGLGYDGAKVVAMGTETAGNPEDPEELAYDCLQTAVILSGSPEGVVKSVLKGSS